MSLPILPFLRKYRALFMMSWRVKWTYKAEQLAGGVFLILVLFVFANLWQSAFSTRPGGISGTLAQGYNISELVWYLVFTESIILSLPNVASAIEDDVLMGSLALHLNKPYNYILFHYAQFMGEATFRFLSVAFIGSLTATLLVGPPLFFKWSYLLFFPLLFVVTHTLHFLYLAWIGLVAFWMEDIKGLFFIADRLKWILGGFFMPLTIFPESVQKIAHFLPYPDMLFAPAQLFLRFSVDASLDLLFRQSLWCLGLSVLVWLLFKWGSSRVQMNGG